ncbi:MAG: EF-hand domain-containing protein [Betaproteobacteria bacterium]
MRKLAIPMIATLTLAVGSAFAADTKGFDALDKDNDGYLTRSESAGNARLLKGFDVADKNSDGKLSRTEYLAATAKRKVKDVIGKESDADPGFNALDRNNDGNVTKAEAKGNPYLDKNFDKADGNNDGKLSRAEYLAVMTKKDLKTGAARVDNALDRDAGGGDTKR